MNESYCIGLYTSAGSRLFRTRDETRATLPLDALDRSSEDLGSSAGGTQLLLYKLLDFHPWCGVWLSSRWKLQLIIYCSSKKKQKADTFAVLLLLCGFSTFCCCCWCCFCLSGLRSTFPKWCTLWECLFCAVTRWILCMGVVYFKKTKQNLQMPDLVSCFEGLRCIWNHAATTIHKNLQCQQGLSCGRRGAGFMIIFPFSSEDLFVSQRALARELWLKRRVQLEIAKYYFKTRRLAHMLVIATFNSAVTCMFRRCHYPMRSWKHCRK